MPTSTLSEVAKDGSTYGVTVAFTDENGDAVTPSAITWTLTTATGSVVNSREDVAVGSPASSVTVVLSGDDLSASAAGEQGYLVLTIEATVDTDLGDDLPLKDEIRICIDDLVAV